MIFAITGDGVHKSTLLSSNEMNRFILWVFSVSIQTAALCSEQADTSSTLLVELQYRPRIEYRNGYRELPNDTLGPAYFGTHRCRIGTTYTSSDFLVHLSVQDVRVWGSYGTISTGGSVSVYEAYGEVPLFDGLRLLLGRQSVELDNGRLFSAANWNQHSRAHDGLRLTYSEGNSFNSSLLSFFNQLDAQIFGTSYLTQASNNYKWLGIHTLSVNLSENMQLYVQNSGDGHQSQYNPRVLYVRGTSGVRLSYSHEDLQATVCSYYQYGRLQNGLSIAAYYIQPEFSYRFGDITVRAGGEYMSGDNGLEKAATSKSFVPLYGVTWKFMGNMDYFTTFPSDVRGGGLVNPYLSLTYHSTPKLSVRTDFHLFYLQNNVADAMGAVLPSFLGVEMDMSARYIHSKHMVLEGGLSLFRATSVLAELRGGNANSVPKWIYVMLTISPVIFERAVP